jgi:hypothetical protein
MDKYRLVARLICPRNSLGWRDSGISTQEWLEVARIFLLVFFFTAEAGAGGLVKDSA